MTREEIARDVLAKVRIELLERWKEGAIGYPLTPEGDESRRLAATKAAVMDDVLNEVETLIARGNA